MTRFGQLVSTSVWRTWWTISAVALLTLASARVKAEQPVVVTLESAIRRLLSYNLDLVDQRVATEAARLGMEVAEEEFRLLWRPAGGWVRTDDGSGMRTLGVAMERQFVTGTGISVAPTATYYSGIRSTDVVVTLRQALAKGASVAYNRAPVDDAASNFRSAQRAQRDRVAAEVLRLISVLGSIDREEEVGTILSKSLAESIDRVTLTEARERAGLASTLDVVRSRMAANEIERQVEEQLRRREYVHDELARLLDFDDDAPLLVGFTLEGQEIGLPGERESIEAARSRRTEVLEGIDALADASRRYRQAQHGRRPTIDLVATGVYSTKSFYGPEDDDQVSWTIGMATTIDTNRVARRASVWNAASALERVERDAERVTRAVVAEVRQRLRELGQAIVDAASHESRINLAATKLAIAEAKFANGLADNFDLVEAEQELRMARVALVDARLQALVGFHRLLYARGDYVDWIERVCSCDAS